MWLVDLPLIELALAEINLVDSYRTVREYWCCMKGWRWSDLEGLLPPQICSRLSIVMMRGDERGKDGLCWKGSKMGSFTISSAYNLTMQQP